MNAQSADTRRAVFTWCRSLQLNLMTKKPGRLPKL